MSIIAVSDVHLGIAESNDKTFLDILELLNSDAIDDFVLLGDIINLWRRYIRRKASDHKSNMIMLTLVKVMR